MRRRYTESGVLHRAAQNLNLEDALTDSIGGGWEHVLHEVLHYVVAVGMKPAGTSHNYDIGEFSRKVNEVIEDVFRTTPERDKHEIVVAGLEKTLARRFGVRVDSELLAEAVQANVVDWTVKDVRKAMRKVHAKRGRYGKALRLAEEFIREVAG